MLTLEEVTLAYQLFLGRAPESQSVVTNLCHTLNSTRELRNAFLKSSEFRTLIEDELSLKSESRHRHPFIYQFTIYATMQNWPKKVYSTKLKI